MLPGGRDRLLTAALLALALGARVGYGLWRPPQPPGGPVADPDGYVTLARSFAQSLSFNDRQGRPSAAREPLYPIALGSAFKALGERYAAVLSLHALLSLLMLVMLRRLTEDLFGRAAGWIAAGIAALYPPFVYYASLALRETMMAAVAVAMVLAALRAHRRATLGAAALAGAVFGLGGLTNSTFLPFGPLAASLLAALAPARSAGSRRAAACLAALVVVYLPWPVRNALVFRKPIIGSTAGAGSTFYAYLVVPQRLGGTPEQHALLSADPVVRGAEGMDDAERETYFWREGLARVRREPWAYARLVAWRFFWDQWRIWPRERPYGLPYRTLKWVSALSDGWIVPLGLLGLALSLRRSREALYPAAFVAAVGGAYALIFTMLRYRLSLMPLLIAFAASLIVRLRRA